MRFGPADLGHDGWGNHHQDEGEPNQKITQWRDSLPANEIVCKCLFGHNYGSGQQPQDTFASDKWAMVPWCRPHGLLVTGGGDVDSGWFFRGRNEDTAQTHSIVGLRGAWWFRLG